MTEESEEVFAELFRKDGVKKRIRATARNENDEKKTNLMRRSGDKIVHSVFCYYFCT